VPNLEDVAPFGATPSSTKFYHAFALTCTTTDVQALKGRPKSLIKSRPTRVDLFHINKRHPEPSSSKHINKYSPFHKQTHNQPNTNYLSGELPSTRTQHGCRRDQLTSQPLLHLLLQIRRLGHVRLLSALQDEPSLSLCSTLRCKRLAPMMEAATIDV
jgi:hypothetical protein